MAGLWFETALLPDGWAHRVRIGIAGDGVIASITTDTASEPADERHAIALPGVPNLHSHAFQRAMAGLTERRGASRDSFWTWRDLMYRFAQRLDPDLLEAVAALAFVEMLESGFTRAGEFHYVHHQPSGAGYDDPAAMARSVAAAAAATGIGLTLLPVFYAAAGFGGQPPSVLQNRFINTLDGFERVVTASEVAVSRLPDGLVGIAPHSLRAVSPEQLSALATMRSGQPIHIHVAEQIREVEDCVAWSGQRPVDWLCDHVAVDRRWCLVHATHVTADELDRIARSRAVAGLCPVTEANLGDGIFPADDLLARNGPFGIGSDSNVAIDAAGELRLLEYGQRLSRQARNILGDASRSTGRVLLDGAIRGGAQALGQTTAGLAVGTSADIIGLDRSHAALIERDGDALIDGWIFAAGASAIDRVWRRGKLVVRDGRHVARDAIAARYRLALTSLLDEG